MNTDAIVRLVLMLGIPAFMMWREYKKMSKEERNEVKTDFTSKRFIATYGLVALSLIFLLVEPIFETTWVKVISAVLISFGMIVSSFFTWLNASSKCKAVLGIISSIIALAIFLWAIT
ncbi:hypothetical protein [Peribacillus sp. Bi134]|uniref:hypothetical protein n=1 Tax=Peribacillus sp. Bi134 TaxID=2884272 RepID=UPI001E0F9232|nr:hypothetical protein [Peribacillus sp. Bi134]CAH0292117.1 hypothetical protein SRABI134_04360 [Peribacillus sp. Bi134]